MVIASKGNEAIFDMNEWKTFMEKSAGKKIEVTVTALKEGQWTIGEQFIIDCMPKDNEYDSERLYIPHRKIMYFMGKDGAKQKNRMKAA